MLTAAIAVGAVILVKFAVALVQLIGNAVDFDPAAYASGFVESPIGLFLGAVVLYPFFFYVGAFVALAFGFPVLRSTRLPVVLGRAVAAGAVGTIVLALVGLITGVGSATAAGNWVSLLLDVVFVPLSAGLLLTAVLAAGAVLAWLWIGRQDPALRAQDAMAAAGTPARVAEAAAAAAAAVTEAAGAGAAAGAAGRGGGAGAASASGAPSAGGALAAGSARDAPSALSAGARVAAGSPASASVPSALDALLPAPDPARLAPFAPAAAAPPVPSALEAAAGPPSSAPTGPLSSAAEPAPAPAPVAPPAPPPRSTAAPDPAWRRFEPPPSR
ncbi:hypothetical protein AX769_10190 [Frondihabitans sp. PAMC 28766]|uniref:hypothetical protein n=1 Tax=Frondihabitans sp. PAMC 28766 TaxID=1795630 RepID=UPI00078C68FC|nr:hypothetical protein [Frondihabitans sp. PAMC 28766]AMM20449.1 hypothetical protein AX769_10190 [Frondihabitans sp. PAMC 28766]